MQYDYKFVGGQMTLSVRTYPSSLSARYTESEGRTAA
jgi:hypothetical protein